MSPSLKNHLENQFGPMTVYEKIGAGSNYDVYKFICDNYPYVLRVQKRAVYDFSAHEYKVLQMLNGEYAPKVHYLGRDKVSNETFMVIDFIEGEVREMLSIKDVKSIVNVCKCIQKKYTRRAKSLLASEYFYKVYQEKFGRGIDVISQSNLMKKQQFKEYLCLVNDLISRYGNQKTKTECLIHGDLNHTNILWCRGTPQFIDWELSRYSIPEFEYGGICYCHGKTEALFNSILSLFNNDPLVVVSFALKTVDSIFWRVKWLLEVKLSSKDLECQRKYFELDIQKMNYIIKKFG